MYSLQLTTTHHNSLVLWQDIIPMPARAPASNAPTVNASVGSDVLTDWSVNLGLALTDTVAHGDFSNAYLYSAREDHAADL